MTTWKKTFTFANYCITENDFGVRLMSRKVYLKKSTSLPLPLYIFFYLYFNF